MYNWKEPIVNSEWPGKTLPEFCRLLVVQQGLFDRPYYSCDCPYGSDQKELQSPVHFFLLPSLSSSYRGNIHGR